LPSELWVQLREQLVDSVLDLDESFEQSQGALSRLCRYLGDHAGELRTGTVWTELLSPARIDTYAPAGLKGSSRIRLRRDLRRVSIVVGQAPTKAPPVPSGALPSAAAFWPLVTGCGPFTACAAAWERAGYAFSARTWVGLDLMGGDAPAGVAACVEPPTTGTLPADLLVLRSLRSAGAALEKVSTKDERAAAVSAGRLTTAGRAPARPLSRAAALKAARAAYARAQEQPQPRVAELPELPEPIAAAIAAFHPQRCPVAWDRISVASRALMTAYRPVSVRWVSTQGGQLVKFAAWAYQRPGRAGGVELQLEELLDPQMVEQYLAGPVTASPAGTQATVRSILRRAVRELSGTKPVKIGYTAVQPPYTDAECAAFVRLARNQPTSAKRRALSALVALGLGAGLDGREQKSISPDRVREVDLGDQIALVVSVGGERAREVVVRAGYDALLREALHLHETEGRRRDQPLYGRSSERNNVTTAVTTKAVTATGSGVDINATRLRATWLVALMQAPVPLSVLLRTAGLRGARTLVDLLPHCAEPTEEDIAIVQRAVDFRRDGEAPS
jgi:hypothetical protein